MDSPKYKYEATFSMERIGKFETLKEACECIIKRTKEETKGGFPMMLLETIWIDAMINDATILVNNPADEIPLEEQEYANKLLSTRFGRTAWFWNEIMEICHENGWINDKGVWQDGDQVVQSTFDF